MAKGIPLMGRGPDGKAKIINVDENGNVKVQLSGTIMKFHNSTVNVTLAAGAYVLITLGADTSDCVEFMAFLQMTTPHQFSLKEHFTVGGYGSITTTAREIAMEIAGFSPYRISGREKITSPGYCTIILTNESETSQTYPRLLFNLYRRSA